jgi:hypothetical protein
MYENSAANMRSPEKLGQRKWLISGASADGGGEPLAAVRGVPLDGHIVASLTLRVE